MSAQPVHQDPDPRDPRVIVERLPEQERDFFLAQYHEHAQAAADNIASYQALQRFLHLWSLRARILQRVLAEQPDYYEDLAARGEEIHTGTVETVPIEEFIADRNGIPPEEAAARWRAQVEEAATARGA